MALVIKDNWEILMKLRSTWWQLGNLNKYLKISSSVKEKANYAVTADATT